MAMARTVASATSRTAATATYRITAAAMAAATVTATAMAMATATADSNVAINVRRLLRRPHLGRAAAGEPPFCGSRYCCIGEKGREGHGQDMSKEL